MEPTIFCRCSSRSESAALQVHLLETHAAGPYVGVIKDIKVMVSPVSSLKHLKMLNKSNFVEKHLHLGYGSVWKWGYTTKKHHMIKLLHWIHRKNDDQPVGLGYTIFRQNHIRASWFQALCDVFYELGDRETTMWDSSLISSSQRHPHVGGQKKSSVMETSHGGFQLVMEVAPFMDGSGKNH